MNLYNPIGCDGVIFYPKNKNSHSLYGVNCILIVLINAKRIRRKYENNRRIIRERK